MRRPRTRAGFALVLAVCLLATVAGLAGGSFYAVREARRAATRFASQEEAASRADAALVATLFTWDALRRDSLLVGATDSSGGPPGALSQSFVTRITNVLYSIAGVGSAAVGTAVEARRVHALLVRTSRPQPPMRAAILTAGDVIVGRDAMISGDDRAPPGWQYCPPADSGSMAPVIVPDGRTVRDDAGVPLADARFDPVAADLATYQTLGPVTLAALAAGADIQLPAGAILSPRPSPDDQCGVVGDSSSWGEPTPTVDSPRCSRFFPVVHAAGDIVVTAGRGQGLLLVDGNLRIDGPFLFHGIIVANGGLETRGIGVTVYGAVLSATAGAVRWLASGLVQRSTCAVIRASTAAARPVPVERRAWSELF